MGFPKSVGRVGSRLLGFPCFPYSVISMACSSPGRRWVYSYIDQRNEPYSEGNVRRDCCRSVLWRFSIDPAPSIRLWAFLGIDLARSVCLSQVRLMMSSRKAACLICSESQILMNERDCHAAFSDPAGYPFDGIVSHVSRRKNARQTRFQG